MTKSIVYECPECTDRKLLDHSQQHTHPTMWCNCDGMVKMEIDVNTEPNE